MNDTHQITLTKYLLHFIAGLKASGVKQAVISPGSRSTPLSLLLFHDKEIECFIDVDERSAGFFSLGLSKVAREPVALVCTSGTAAANYYPSICEANASNVPLIVLTTDRPPELRDVGAPQAMMQQQLFGAHVKTFMEMATPESGEEMLQYSYWRAMHVTQTAQQQPVGPVHFNLPLREPLLPDLTLTIEQLPATAVCQTTTQLQSALPKELWERPGIIVVGGEVTIAEAKQLIQLSEQLNWPIFGDPLTNLSNCGYDNQHYLKQAELIFSQELSELTAETVILRFGTLPVTKNIWLTLKNCPCETWIYVDEAQQWLDQTQRANLLVPLSITAFTQMITDTTFSSIDSTWIKRWQTYQKAAEQALRVPELQQFSESHASQLIWHHLPDNSQFFLSNSNAIRFIDRLTGNLTQTVTVQGNRGVNGIDGIASTVAGIAARSQQPTYLLTGDLAFFHDLTGLQMIKQYNLDVTIILLNNNGGGIFSFLPQQSLDATSFAALFGTPLDLDFAHAAQLYNANYEQVTTDEQFITSLNKTSQLQGLRIIEVQGKQSDGPQIWQAVQRAYKEILGQTHV